jgi:putative membrane protein
VVVVKGGVVMFHGNVCRLACAAGLCAVVLGCKRDSEANVGAPRAISPAAAPSLAPTRAMPPPAPVVPVGSSAAAESAAGGAATEQYAAEVLATLHQDNQNEIQMGKLAQQMGQASAVKDYGTMLVAEHTAADERLTTYASTRNLPLDRSSKAEQKATEGRQNLEKLRTVEGGAFDRAFAGMMIDGHEQALALVTDAREKVVDPDLKALLADLAPTLKKHLQHARALAAANQGNAADEAAPAPRTQGRRPVSR